MADDISAEEWAGFLKANGKATYEKAAERERYWLRLARETTGVDHPVMERAYWLSERSARMWGDLARSKAPRGSAESPRLSATQKDAVI